MSRIRGKDTTPEKRVRSLFHRLGFRFRLHVRIPVTNPPQGRGDAERRSRNQIVSREVAKAAKPTRVCLSFASFGTVAGQESSQKVPTSRDSTADGHTRKIFPALPWPGFSCSPALTVEQV